MIKVGQLKFQHLGEILFLSDDSLHHKNKFQPLISKYVKIKHLSHHFYFKSQSVKCFDIILIPTIIGLYLFRYFPSQFLPAGALKQPPRFLYLKRQKRVQRPFCGNPRNRHQSKLSILIVYQISQNMSENKRPADGENGSNGATDTKKPKSVSTFCLFHLSYCFESS